MEEVVQRWSCPKCGGVYESYVNVTAVSCRRKHSEQKMVLVEGEVVVHHPPSNVRRDVRLPEPPKARVKAGRISTLEELAFLMEKE